MPRSDDSRSARLLTATSWACSLALVLGPLATARSARAEEPRTRILRGITVAPTRGATVVEVHFDAPLRYLSHNPARRGTTLEIRLRLEPSGSPSDLRRNEVVEWRDRDVVALVDVELDADSGGNPRLLVHFDRPAEFDVSQDSDLTRLRIAVLRDEATESRGRAGSQPGTGGEAVLDEGRKAMTAGDYRRAVLLFSKVLEDPAEPHAQEAQELLGLAHQRQGQLAHARRDYEAYLARYPEGEGAARVKQRLQAMLTVNDGRQPEAPRAKADRAWSHSLSGSLAQFYRSNVLQTDETGSETTNSSFDSDLFLTSRHEGAGSGVRTQFAASYRQDLLGQTDASEALRVTSGFVDANWRSGKFTLRAGRQSAVGGGILGRFDGVLAGRRFGERWKLNLVSGFPVDFTESNRVNHDRPFYGFSVDTGTFLDHWDAQLFSIWQQIDGIDDRQAVGGQLRFTHVRGFGLALVDYDTSYSELNSAMFIANWRVTDATNVNALVDVRKSPVLTTFNAIQGQLVTSIEDLQDLLDEDEIRELAEARTASSRMATLGISHQLNPTWQLGADATLSSLSGTEATLLPQPIDATEGTGTEAFYSLRSSANGLLVDGSFTSFDLRYADTSTARRYSFGASARYPLFRGLRFGPQGVVELRRLETGEKQWRYRPGLRLDYRWRRFVFELDGGLDVQTDTNTADGDQRNYYLNVGYRRDF